MDTLIKIISSLLASTGTTIIEAHKKKYAEKKGLDPSEPDAALESTKNLFLRLLFSIALLLFLIAWFMQTASSRETYARWSNEAAQFAQDLAVFMPRLLTVFSLFFFAYAVYSLLVYLSVGKNEADIVKKTMANTVQGFRHGLGLVLATVISLEAAYITTGDLSAIKPLLNISNADVKSYLFLMVFLAAFYYYIFAVWCTIRTIPKLLDTIESFFIKTRKSRRKKRYGKHAAS